MKSKLGKELRLRAAEATFAPWLAAGAIERPTPTHWIVFHPTADPPLAAQYWPTTKRLVIDLQEFGQPDFESAAHCTNPTEVLRLLLRYGYLQETPDVH